MVSCVQQWCWESCLRATGCLALATCAVDAVQGWFSTLAGPTALVNSAEQPAVFSTCLGCVQGHFGGKEKALGLVCPNRDAGAAS